MSLSHIHRLILYALGEFYESINQPLIEKPVKVRSSKIMFIHLLLNSGLVIKHERALYKNLETLEKKKLIVYDSKMIQFTKDGLDELGKVRKEITEFSALKTYLQTTKSLKGKWQTVLPE